ncbi:unnamed protein product [Pleuronectes platessa]|uniref:Uncharacterized protein n=1 Tax=Pleuronectes platessa TaxID=8262 RepID=A0A9N7UCW8_PLEPL|nr:unnamed protein product [Pleuronectes platessa]
MFIFVVKPLGTCRSWGSSPSVALLSAAGGSVCGTGRSSSGGTSRRHWWGGFLSLGPRGRCPSTARKAGRWRGPGTAVGGGHSGHVSGPFADHLSYGDRWGNPPAGA